MIGLLDYNQDIDKKFREARKAIETLKDKIKTITSGQDHTILRTEASTLKNKGTWNRKSPQHYGLFLLERGATFPIQRQLNGHFGKIYAMDWSSDNEEIVSASNDGQLIIWNIFNKTKKVAISLRSEGVMTCAYSPNCQYIACGGTDNLLTIFDVKDTRGWDINEPLKELSGHDGYISCARFMDDNQILTASGDRTCVLWDIIKETEVQRFKGHVGDIECLAINPKHVKMFVTGSVDAVCKCWDIREQGKLFNFKGHKSDINDVTWFPDGKAFISGSDDKTVRLFDVSAYKQLNMYASGDIEGSVTSVGCSKSGYYIITAYDEKPYCLAWNTMTSDRECIIGGKDDDEKEMDKGKIHNTRVSCLQVSPNGKYVATGCWDRCLRIWGNMS